MAKKQYSRLAKTEAKKASKSAFIYILLTIVLVVVLPRYGLQALSSFTDFLTGISGRQVINNQDNSSGTLLGAPKLNPLPEYTSDTKLRVTGTAPPGESIEIFLNEDKNEVLTDAQGEFTTIFTLRDEQSYTTYAVVVKNNGDRSSESSRITTTYDRTPPEIEIIDPENGSTFYGGHERNKRIQGQVSENDKVTINDRIVIVGSDGKFDHRVTLGDGENIFTIKVIDPAGNESEQELRVSLVN